MGDQKNTGDENSNISPAAHNVIEVETLKTVIADNEARILAHEKTIADQAKKIVDHEATIEEYGKTIDEKTEVIVKQSAILKKLQSEKSEAIVKEKKEVKKKPEFPKEPVEHEGKKYRFRFAAFYYKATRYEAQDVAIKDDLIAEILSDKNQTLLIQVF